MRTVADVCRCCNAELKNSIPIQVSGALFCSKSCIEIQRQNYVRTLVDEQRKIYRRFYS